MSSFTDFFSGRKKRQLKELISTKLSKTQPSISAEEKKLLKRF